MARNEKIGITLALMALAAILTFASFAANRPAHAGGQAIQCFDSGQALASTSPFYFNNCASASATTSPIFLGVGQTGATTTLMTGYIPNATALDINFLTKASSTASTLVWNVYFSNNGIDWYKQSNAAYTGNNDIFASSTSAWTPGSISANFLNLRISSVGEKYFRIDASAAVASTSVYAQAVTANSLPN